MNQIELHPRFPQDELRAYHADHQIATEAWSPIGQGQGLLEDPTIRSIAEAHGKTPAQVVLHWHVQLGQRRHPEIRDAGHASARTSTCSTSSSDDGEMALLSSLSSGEHAGRIGPDPAHFNAA